MNTKTRFRSH